TVTARVVATGSGIVSGNIYDYSGSSYHYNKGGATISVTSSNPTGSFSLQKLVTDPTNAVPDAQTFTVRYSVNGGASTAVNLVAGAAPTVISGIPTGATVTFTEDTPSFTGVNWGTPVFNPSSASITIGNGTTVPVTVSNPFTLQTGSFSLQKFVSDPGNVVPDATPFTVRYSVNGGASTAVQLIAGDSPTVISGIPTGATVTFTEDAPSFGGVNWGTPIFSPAGASITIGNGTTVPVTVSNPFSLQTGSFSLQKSVTDPTDAVPDGTEFTVNYSVNGGASTPVTLVAGAAPTVISGLPTGATVTFTEDAPSFGGVNWGTPVFNPPSASITIGNGTTVPVTVSNPFTLQTGSFTLQKLITDPTDAVPDATTFTVNYSVNGGPSVAVDLVAGAAPTVISGIPTGATVTFTEDTPSFGGVNWGTPVFDPSRASITIGNGTTVPVTVSNPFTLQTGSFSLQKFVTDPTDAVPDGTEFTVNYSVNGGASTPVTLVAGAAPTVISGLPTGATVTFTEDAPSFGGVNWGTPVFNPPSASITIGNGTTVPVTVSNPFTLQTGSFSLQKLITDPTDAVPNATEFTVNYSVDGAPSVAVTLVAGAAPTVISGIPTGATVTFTEDAPSFGGVNWGTPVFDPPSASITIGNGTNVPVTVTNPFTIKTGTFSLQKLLSGSGAGLVPDGTIFEVEYSTSGLTGPWTTVELDSDGTVVAGPTLATGTVVDFREVVRTVSGVNLISSTFNSAQITIGDGTNVAVTVTNEFETQVPAISLLKSVSSIDLGADGVLGVGDVITYAFTVTNTGNVALSNVRVTDDLATMAGGPISLAVGASDSTTFTATYELTLADVTAGGVENTATAVGSPPSGDDVTDVSDTGTGVDGDPVGTPELTETPSPLGGLPNDGGDPTDDPTTVRILPSAADDEDLDNTIGDAVEVFVLVNDSVGLVPSTVRILTPVTGAPVTSLVVAGEGEWTVDPITGAITFTPEVTFLGDPTPVDYRAANGFGDTAEATVTITYVEPTGGFSLIKTVVDDLGDKVPADAEFTVKYSVDGAPPVSVTLVDGAAPIEVTGLPIGAVVTFTEDPAPAFLDVVWQAPRFDPPSASIVITTGIIPVTAINAVDLTTLAPPEITSRAYVDGQPNGRITTGPATIIDRVFYLNLVPDQQYRLDGELVYIENGVIVYTGITGGATFTPTTADGTTEVPFSMSEQDVIDLASKKLFIFLTLYNEADEEVAFDGAIVASDPWFDTTEEWFTIAPAGLALTGAASTISLVGTGVSALLAGLVLMLFGRRRRTNDRVSAA
ncbi:DUF5979 domain-containing protein, partial [Microcella sp.]|uniref:DUF5979 domain-containing protein n=1 Tax=Microcella sp. TaxID=1913979 RepID=UPI00299F6F30